MIRWTEELAIGNEQIDMQHQVLIQTLEDLYEACSRGEGVKTLARTINFLIEYVDLHFRQEEALQRQYNYAKYEFHKKIHERYKIAIRKLVKKESEEAYTTEDLAKVIRYLNKVIVEHIYKEDFNIAWFIKGEKAKLGVGEDKRIARDPLTGLLGEVALYKKIAEEIVLHPDREYVCVGVNIKGFSQVNHTYGFDIGDQAIMYISGILQMSCKYVVAMGRVYGDRFGILLDNEEASLEEIKCMLDNTKRRIEEGFRRKGGVIPLSVSVGLVRYPEDAKNVKEFREAVSIALDYSQESPGHPVVDYKTQMRQQIVRRSEIIKALQPYHLENYLRVVYQPICDTKTGKVIGCEGLLRLVIESGASISPVEFIPLAEANGLSNELTYFTLRAVGKLLEELPREKIKYISVNLSPKQFEDRAFIDQLKEIVKINHLDMTRIFFEITESAVVENFEEIQRYFRELRTMGSQILIDDFGQGYSALSYLSRMEADTLKIDKSFLEDIHESTKRQTILEKIITLAHEMEFDVVVEGVESHQDWEILQKMKADKVQGFLFGKPLERQQILQLD